MKFKNKFLILSAILSTFLLSVVSCTSLGHVSRSTPKFAKKSDSFAEIAFDGDDNALSVAIEHLFEKRGIKVRLPGTPKVRETVGLKEYEYKELNTRYGIRVRSQDLDACIPEGSKQMHFDVSVVDYQERNRVFLMNGEYGCLDTLLNNFDAWLISNQN